MGATGGVRASALLPPPLLLLRLSHQGELIEMEARCWSVGPFCLLLLDGVTHPPTNPSHTHITRTRIQVVGDRPGAADQASDEYVSLLLRELGAALAVVDPSASTSSVVNSDQGMGGIDPRRVRAAGGLTSIFFGGGTPSLTPPRLVKAVVAALEGAFGLAEGAEVGGREWAGCVFHACVACTYVYTHLYITQLSSNPPPNKIKQQISMEMDPGTFDAPRLKAFLEECGVTRVSMGVQAFDAGLLAACGRAHRSVGGWLCCVFIEADGCVHACVWGVYAHQPINH